VLNDEARVDKGENARMSSFVGAIAIADLVKTTLGPKGMDKILQSVRSGGGQAGAAGNTSANAAANAAACGCACMQLVYATREHTLRRAVRTPNNPVALASWR
jgi:hypothetical protein